MKRNAMTLASAVFLLSAMALALCLLASCNAPRTEPGSTDAGSADAPGKGGEKTSERDKPDVIFPDRAVDDPVFIHVRNATEISGLNLSIPHRLTSMGYDSEHRYSVTGLKPNITDQPYTLIAYASEDMEDIAHRVAEHLGIDQLGDLPGSGSGSPRVFLNPPGDDGYLIEGDILVLIGDDWVDRSYPYPY